MPTLPETPLPRIGPRVLSGPRHRPADRDPPDRESNRARDLVLPVTDVRPDPAVLRVAVLKVAVLRVAAPAATPTAVVPAAPPDLVVPEAPADRREAVDPAALRVEDMTADLSDTAGEAPHRNVTAVLPAVLRDPGVAPVRAHREVLRENRTNNPARNSTRAERPAAVATTGTTEFRKKSSGTTGRSLSPRLIRFPR